MNEAEAAPWAAQGTHPVDYKPALDGGMVDRAFSGSLDALTDAVDPGSDPPVGAQWLDAAEKDRLLGSREVVRRFVACEFDAETPGNAGLGRLGSQWPRLGGVFRTEVRRPDVRSQLGPLIEELICIGYAVAVMFNVVPGTVERPEPRERSVEELWQLWIANASQGMAEGPGIVGVAAESTMFRFQKVAEELGLKRRLGRKRKVLLMVAGFYALSGAALYEVQTESADIA